MPRMEHTPQTPAAGTANAAGRPDAATEAKALETFRSRFHDACPFPQDRKLADEVTAEVATVLATLVAREFESGRGSSDHHEALALTTLLGRRVHLLQVSPPAASAVPPALLEALTVARVHLPDNEAEVLRALYFEGYTRAMMEAEGEARQRALVAAQAMLMPMPGVGLLVLNGPLEPESLAAVGDEFGRMLFRGEAEAAVIDISGLGAPTRAHAAEAFALDATTRMLGVPTIFVGADDRWQAMGKEAGVLLDALTFASSVQEALSAVLAKLGRGEGFKGLMQRLTGRK